MKRILLLLSCAGLALGACAFISACGANGDGGEVAPTSAPATEAAETGETATATPPTEGAPQPEVPSTTTVSTDDGLDSGLFFEGALVGEVTTESCTLSGGVETTCYQVTVVGLPVDHDVGPFCPPTISSTAEEGGIWLDGDGLWDIDGEFITGLATLYGDANWLLYDEDGNVNITNTREAFEAAARPNVAPEYRNHCVEGRLEWLPDGEPVTTTVLIPTVPVVADAPAFNEALLGVTLNGVRIDGAAPIDAILRAYTIAAFDDCGGHYNPFEGYHMHASMGCSGIKVEGHGLHFAYALDGYAIFTALPEGESGDVLDQCGGHEGDGLGYHYHAAPPAENAVVRCLTGQFVSNSPGGGGGPRGERR